MIITNASSLRAVSLEVSSLEEERKIVSLLERELEQANHLGSNGIGLAAPQIGINKRAAIVRVGRDCINLINSKILDGNNKTKVREGCLSLPGQQIEVERFLDLCVQNHSFNDNRKYAAYGLSSVCIQHEMDHWDGVLITDKAIANELNIGPNMPCPCNSGLKYKKCCLSKTAEKKQ